MPAPRKLLPRPCPQCNKVNGGLEYVLFNPRYYEERTGYPRSTPYVLLRIKHYVRDSPLMSKSAKKKGLIRRKKEQHTFSTKYGFNVKLDHYDGPVQGIFNAPGYRYRDSVRIPISSHLFEEIKENGWPIFVNDRAHRFNKVGIKTCQLCGKSVDSLKKSLILLEDEHVNRKLVHEGEYIWLCQTCHQDRKSGLIYDFFSSLLKRSGYHPGDC